MTCDQAYHSSRARTERELATRSADARASDAHLRLSALHLSRALLLEELERNFGAQREVGPAAVGRRARRPLLSIAAAPARR